MAISNFVKRIQDVMRNDSGVNGDAQRIEQIVWILFLKIYDAKEETWELLNDNYKSIIPEGLKWRDWAVDRKDGEALTGDALLDFVNNTLFPTLKNLEIDVDTPMSQVIVRYAFEDANNYQKDGVLLRQVVNIIDEIENAFRETCLIHKFGKEHGRHRRNLGRLQDDGAADRKCWNNFQRDLVHRPVPRRNEAANTDWFAHDRLVRVFRRKDLFELEVFEGRNESLGMREACRCLRFPRKCNRCTHFE